MVAHRQLRHTDALNYIVIRYTYPKPPISGFRVIQRYVFMPRHVLRPPLTHSSLEATPHAQWAGEDRLRDFSTDRRLVMLMAMAVVVGCAGAVAAWTLYHLIALVTNIAYYGRFSAALVSPPVEGLRWTSVLIPVAGCLL